MPAELSVPETIECLESTEAIESFRKLSPHHRQFSLEYIDCWNAAEAYRRVYNKLASSRVATNCGSRLLASAGIKPIIQAFLDTKEEDFITVRETYLEAVREAVKPVYGKDEAGQPIKIEDLPDYDVRIKGAQALAKLHGLNAPEKQITVTISVADLLKDARERAKAL